MLKLIAVCRSIRGKSGFMFHILFISLLYIIVCIVEMPKYTIKDALLEVMGTNEITFFTRFVNLKHSKEDATTKL